MKRAWIPAVVMVLLLVLPETALACPVCFDARDENRMAFLGTAILLTFLPLGMVGGVGLWVRRRVRDMESESFQGDEDQTRG